MINARKIYINHSLIHCTHAQLFKMLSRIDSAASMQELERSCCRSCCKMLFKIEADDVGREKGTTVQMISYLDSSCKHGQSRIIIVGSGFSYQINGQNPAILLHIWSPNVPLHDCYTLPNDRVSEC